ncbi:phage tail length tape measure family protein [Polaromonas sp.]|uniref:phage tail length tape measure family protein n=1 Tax=Polaromonas sp. TaxID=1869339 RepID=UPI00272EF760|nr:phage tail length tape measure family protein [Polaromonas sp.]MDP1886641.1 phage tail length tape measure family protein [Polaromonas sp.]
MERLGIIVALDGSLETTNGLKLTSDAANELGRELDALNAKTGSAAQGQKAVADASKAAGSAAAESAKGVGQLAGELARGDFKGAAMNVGELALSSQMLTGTMVGVAALVGTVVVGLGTLAYAAFEGAEEQRKLNDTLILTGNYAGLVAGQLDAMASSLARNVNSSVSDSRAQLAGLTATGKFTVMSLEEVAAAAQLVARFTGQSTDQVTRQFASMGDGVADWAAKTNSSYHFLSIETFRYIKQLEEQGRVQDAMRVTSEALSRHLGGDLSNNLGTLQKAWKGVSDWAKDAWTAMMGLGKTETTQEKIDSITARLNALATRKTTGRVTGDQRAEMIAAMESERSMLESDLRQERQLAARRSETAQLTQLQIDKEQEKKKKPRGGKSAAEKEADAQNRLIAETAGLSPTFAADWDRLTEIQRRNGLTVEWLTEAQGKLLAKQPAIRTEAQHQATALRELTQLRERANQNMERDFANQEKELESMIKTNEGLREQAQQVGLTKVQLGNLKAERLDGLIAQERENLIVAESNDAGERQLELMRRKISLLEQQRGLTQEVTAKTDAADKTKAAEDASKKFGEDVRRDLKDGIIRGFEAGKSPMKAFGDTLGNIVKERLLSSFADSLLNGFEPLLKQILGRIQLPGMGGGGGGGGGLGGIFDSIFGGGMGTDIIPQGAAASAAEFGGGGMMDALASFGVFHSGGMAGGAAPGSRTVSASLFKGAPRFHGGGIASNERAIIAKDDEGIFTRDQMANLAPVGAAAPVINIITPPGTKAETRQRQGANGGMQTDVIISQLEEALADRVSAGTGSLFGSMQDRFGLRTQVG